MYISIYICICETTSVNVISISITPKVSYAPLNLYLDLWFMSLNENFKTRFLAILPNHPAFTCGLQKVHGFPFSVDSCANLEIQARLELFPQLLLHLFVISICLLIEGILVNGSGTGEIFFPLLVGFFHDCDKQRLVLLPHSSYISHGIYSKCPVLGGVLISFKRSKGHLYSRGMPQGFPVIGKATVTLDCGCQNLDTPGRSVQ